MAPDRGFKEHVFWDFGTNMHRHVRWVVPDMNIVLTASFSAIAKLILGIALFFVLHDMLHFIMVPISFVK